MFHKIRMLYYMKCMKLTDPTSTWSTKISHDHVHDPSQSQSYLVWCRWMLNVECEIGKISSRSRTHTFIHITWQSFENNRLSNENSSFMRSRLALRAQRWRLWRKMPKVVGKCWHCTPRSAHSTQQTQSESFSF